MLATGGSGAADGAAAPGEGVGEDWQAWDAGALAALDVPCFACTPDLFPELMAAAITRSDVAAWAAARDIAVARRKEG